MKEKTRPEVLKKNEHYNKVYVLLIIACSILNGVVSYLLNLNYFKTVKKHESFDNEKKLVILYIIALTCLLLILIYTAFV